MAGQELTAQLLTCIQAEKQARFTVSTKRTLMLYEDMEHEPSVNSEETHSPKRSLAYCKRNMRAPPNANSIAKRPAAIADHTAETGASVEQSKGNLDKKKTVEKIKECLAKLESHTTA